MSISNKLRIALNPAELMLVFRIVTVLLILPALLRLLNICRVGRLLTPYRTHVHQGRLSQERTVYLCGRMLNAFARFSYKTNCLRRCLLLYHCLRRYGIPVLINFGVKPGGKELLGHCWLTLEGRLIYDRVEMVDQFTHVFFLPESPKGRNDQPEMGNEIADLETVSFNG